MTWPNPCTPAHLPREIKTNVGTKTWTYMNVYSSFVHYSPQTGSNPVVFKCLSTDNDQPSGGPSTSQDTAQLWKGKELLTYPTAWMNLRRILSKKIHSWKVTYHRISFFFFFFKQLHLQHMEVPRLEVESELQPPAIATATAMQDPSHLRDLHWSLQQQQIHNPLGEARDPTCVRTRDNIRCLTHWVITGTPDSILEVRKL